MEELVEEVTAAIRRSVPALEKSFGEGGIAGCCLLLDCDMISLGMESVSRKFIDEAEDKWMLFSPVEWDTSPGPCHFSQAAGLLEETCTDAGYEDRARAVVGGLVRALRQARELEDALQQVFLLIYCTDSGGVWDELHREAV
ncbi:MAG: hypothetical protein AAF533_26390 [Acidobacteriota bacterium]